MFPFLPVELEIIIWSHVFHHVLEELENNALRFSITHSYSNRIRLSTNMKIIYRISNDKHITYNVYEVTVNT